MIDLVTVAYLGIAGLAGLTATVLGADAISKGSKSSSRVDSKDNYIATHKRVKGN